LNLFQLPAQNVSHPSGQFLGRAQFAFPDRDDVPAQIFLFSPSLGGRATQDSIFLKRSPTGLWGKVKIIA
jgi:hypothetical protein